MPIPILPAAFAAGKKFFSSKVAEWLIPSVLSAGGAMRQQSTARQFAREQMDFQERMASSQAQRSRADFEAAGLNPALAYGTQAASPSGATSAAENIMGAGVSSAQAARMMQRQLALLDQQILDASNNAVISGNKASESKVIGDVWRDEEVQKAFSDFMKEKLKADFDEQTERRIKSSFIIDMDPEQRKILEFQRETAGLALPELRNQAAIAELLGVPGTMGLMALQGGARAAELALKARMPRLKFVTPFQGNVPSKK